MRLNLIKTAFGRHESFALRYSWLTKGYRTEKQVFNSDNATVELGVGKNMVKSIQYWLKACQIVDDNMDHTKIGNAIFTPILSISMILHCMKTESTGLILLKK